MVRRKVAPRRRGFTLIEILVVIVIIGVLSIIGVSKYTEFTTRSRVAGCTSNLNSIDKTIGVWESQNVAIPINATHTLSVDTQGAITAVSAVLKALPAPTTPLDMKLDAGKLTLRFLTKDPNVFICPEKTNTDGGTEKVRAAAGTVHLSWKLNTLLAPIIELGNKGRGGICATWGGTKTSGPDGTAATIHR